MDQLEKLHAWMERNGYSAVALNDALGYDRNSAAKIIAGERPIHRSFIWRFNRAFGNEASNEVFGETFSSPAWSDREIYPGRGEAQRAVARAREHGELKPASWHKCATCDKQAVQYHHQSYLPADHLCVVPLCHSCHGKAHWKTLNLPLGVVPTHVGLIRIAISS
jgi:hypothetical protein